MARIATLLSALIAGTCGLRAQATRPGDYDSAPEPLAVVHDEHITEASGIAASRRHPGLYYVHNDSGDSARAFLIDRRGRTRAVVRLKGARADDYEDIAMAPGEKVGTWDVCVADIGDNNNHRRHVTIYRFPEPPLPEQAGEGVDVEPVAYEFCYAEGPANAEAFAVDPRTGDGYVFTKRWEGGSMVYKLAAPWDARQTTELRELLALNLPPALPALRIVTAADISPDGRRLAVRCYAAGWEWRLPSGAPDQAFERIFKATPVELPLAPERQGEGLCYAADGRALLTISEGVGPVLWELRVVSPTTTRSVADPSREPSRARGASERTPRWRFGF
jgi:hypothetical protein